MKGKKQKNKKKITKQKTKQKKMLRSKQQKNQPNQEASNQVQVRVWRTPAPREHAPPGAQKAALLGWPRRGDLEGRGLDVWPAGAPLSIQSSFQALDPCSGVQRWSRPGLWEERPGQVGCAWRGQGWGGAATTLGYAVPPVPLAGCPSSCPGVQLQCKGLTWLQN